MLQTARLPEAKLKPIFDAPQWRLLSRQFAQARAMAQRLKATGVLVDDKRRRKGRDQGLTRSSRAAGRFGKEGC